MKTGGKWWPGLAGMLGLALALAAGEVRGQGQFQGADAVLKRITGAAQAPAEKTESAAEKLGKDIKAFGTGATKLPTLVGSGVTPDNVTSIFQHADAVIVASALKHEGGWWNAVDPVRLAAFMAVVRKARG